MAKGKKVPPETVYNIMLSMFETGNSKESSKNLGIPESTIRTIYRRNKDKEEFVKLRNKKQNDFVTKASEIIDLGTTLLKKRLETAIEKQEELEETLNLIMNADRDEIDPKEKIAMAKKIGRMQLNGLSEITTAVGTLYDKRALAKGESTENKSITITMDESVKELSK